MVSEASPLRHSCVIGASERHSWIYVPFKSSLQTSVATPQTSMELMPTGVLRGQMNFFYLLNRMHHVHFHRHRAPFPGENTWMDEMCCSFRRRVEDGEQSGADTVRSCGDLLPRTVMDVTEILALPAASGSSPSLQPMRR